MNHDLSARRPFPIPVVALGPGSQEEDETLDYISMPSGMSTYRPPLIPDDMSGQPGALRVLQAVLAALAGQGPALVPLDGLAPAERELLNQVLGEGEVSAQWLPAPEGTETGTRDVDEHPVERRRRPRGCRAVGDGDSGAAPDRPADQSSPMGLPLDSQQVGAARRGEPSEHGCLPTGTRAHIEPPRVGAVEVGRRQRQRHQLTALVLHAYPTLTDSGQCCRRAALEDGRGRRPASGPRTQCQRTV